MVTEHEFKMAYEKGQQKLRKIKLDILDKKIRNEAVGLEAADLDYEKLKVKLQQQRIGIKKEQANLSIMDVELLALQDKLGYTKAIRAHGQQSFRIDLEDKYLELAASQTRLGHKQKELNLILGNFSKSIAELPKA